MGVGRVRGGCRGLRIAVRGRLGGRLRIAVRRLLGPGGGRLR
ncbi:hypothetical protein GA0115261_100784, partial [Streptomyces sp. OspMP-M43]